LWTTHWPSPTANVWTSLTVRSGHDDRSDLDRIAVDGAGAAVELDDLGAGIGAAASTQPVSVRKRWSGVVSMVSPSIVRDSISASVWTRTAPTVCSATEPAAGSRAVTVSPTRRC